MSVYVNFYQSKITMWLSFVQAEVRTAISLGYHCQTMSQICAVAQGLFMPPWVNHTKISFASVTHWLNDNCGIYEFCQIKV